MKALELKNDLSSKLKAICPKLSSLNKNRIAVELLVNPGTIHRYLKEGAGKNLELAEKIIEKANILIAEKELQIA